MNSQLLERDNVQLIYHLTQRKVATIDRQRLALHLQAAVEVLASSLKGDQRLFNRGKKIVEVSLTICGSQKIKGLNKEWRQKDKATDVLSFPVHENIRYSDLSTSPFDVISLGDIFICREVAERQAREFEITYEQELVHLLVHGWLHLLGFDHEVSAKEEKIMFELEDKLVKRIYKRLKK